MDQDSADSFLTGVNAPYIEGLLDRYMVDPHSIDSSWKEYFDGLSNGIEKAAQLRNGPSWQRSDWPPKTNGGAVVQEDISEYPGEEESPALDQSQLRAATIDSLRALMMIRAYRVRGHLHANLDPLKLTSRPDHPELDPGNYGFGPADLDRPIYIDHVLGLETATVREIVEILERTYCSTIGVEFMHIAEPEEKSWLQERIEGREKEVSFTDTGKRAILDKTIEAHTFEQFLNTKYTGTKRFGLDGAESLIPGLEQIIKRGGALGLEEIVIGMPHRGRLNVLANVMQKPFKAIFHEVHGGSAHPDEVEGSGDVKYHLGTSADREFDGNNVHLSLTANPSHLEAVDPVVLGKVRAKQAQLKDEDRTKVMGLLLHGDAAFAGQGVVA
ncbi:MAG: thiamine pyrophosphate-dependent enzyme, partial [Alphaproteobacteria bacterium]|nr:thiamine pyrophosphate-dependent enzyme [Alphaproteobacteria bacterium]